MIEKLLEYEKIKNSLPIEIDKSPFKTEHIINKMKISSSTFYRKLRNNTFTTEELIEIFSIIKPEETNNYLLKKSIERGLKDIEEGNTISNKEMKKYIEEKYELDL